MITTEQKNGISLGERADSIDAIAAGSSVTPHVTWHKPLSWFGPRGIAIVATAVVRL